MKSRIALALTFTLFPLAPAGRAAAGDEIAARGPLQLTLKRAVQIATSPEGSARVQLELENVKQAKSRAAEVRAGLLPDVESYLSVSNSVRSLASQGLTTFSLPPKIEAVLEQINGGPVALGFPTRVGPFNTLDIRGTGQQVLFDFGLYRRVQAAHAGVGSAKEQVGNVDDQVTAQVARVYLTALRSDADVEAVQADVDLSQAVLLQSRNQKDAGSGTGIDVTRSSVQLADNQQRLLVAKNNQVKAHLQLLRAMNMRLDTQVELIDKLEYKPVDTLSLQDALSQALATRSDLKAQLRHEDAIRLNASAVKYERLPSIVAQFDYGTIGAPDINILPTRDFYGSIRFPIFDGGRRDARRSEAFSQARQEGVKTADLRDQIELDVRTAMDSLKSTDEQVRVATQGMKLAENELAQSRRRYDAGVAASLEVSDASDRLQRARSNRTQAVYSHSLARIDLGQALGKTLSMLD